MRVELVRMSWGLESSFTGSFPLGQSMRLSIGDFAQVRTRLAYRCSRPAAGPPVRLLRCPGGTAAASSVSAVLCSQPTGV
jgi:hypothetical protein